MIVDKIFAKNVDLGLLIIRLGIGLLFIWGGLAKFVTGIGGPGLEKFAGMLSGTFGEFGLILAVLVGVFELIGGIAVLLGILDREANLILAVIILTSIFLVHLSGGFTPSAVQGTLTHLALVLTFIGLAISGSGKKCLGKSKA